MASSINPNNISVTFPIAGQDNDSQGFRDNFNNIKTNITHAKTEIEDLQSKVILKSALTGSSFSNDGNGSVLENFKLDQRMHGSTYIYKTNISSLYILFKYASK